VDSGVRIVSCAGWYAPRIAAAWVLNEAVVFLT
jgi:hypothetical protein